MYMLNIKGIINKIPTEILIFLLAVLIRLPTLGRDMVNNDAFLWKERGYRFGEALVKLDFSNTAVTYHPGVTLLYNLFVANKIFSLLDKLFYHGSLHGNSLFLVNHQIQKLVLVLFTSFLLAFVYFFLKRIVGRRIGILAMLIILFEPFFLGLGRVVHTDLILSLFMFLGILTFYLAFTVDSYNYNEKNWVSKGLYRKIIYVFPNKVRQFLYVYRYSLVSAIFTGSALLTKSSALYLFALYLLFTLHFIINKKYVEKRKFYIYSFLIVIIGAVMTFTILWPAMWVMPIATLKYYLFRGVKGVAIEEGHKQVWLGHVTNNPGWLYYFVVVTAKYTLVLIVSFLGGILYFIKNFKKLSVNIKLFLSYLLIFWLSYFLMIEIVSKKLDRYSLPLLFPMAVVASFFIISLVRSKKYLVFGIVLVLVFRGLLLYGIHPNYLAYYSPFVGGIERGIYILEPQWPIGYDNVAKYFNKKVESREEVSVVIPDHYYLQPFAKFKVYNIDNSDEAKKGIYFVLPVYTKEEKIKRYKKDYNLRTLKETINLAGVKVYKIYKVNEKGE